MQSKGWSFLSFCLGLAFLLGRFAKLPLELRNNRYWRWTLTLSLGQIMQLVFLLFTICFQICLASVVELHENVESLLIDGPWLINFYANWCGYCRRLSPIFDEVGATLSSLSPTIKVGRIDVSIYSKIAKKFRISEFPTIFFIDGLISVKYTGGRNTRNIVTFALRVNGPAVKHVNTALDFERNVTFFSSDPFFVFIGDRDSALKHDYSQVAEQFRLSSWFLSVPWGVLPQRFARLVGHSDPLEYSLVVFKDDIAIMYSGWDAVTEELRHQHLTQWILKERLPTFQRFEITDLWEFGSSEVTTSNDRLSVTDFNSFPPYRLVVLFLVNHSNGDLMTLRHLDIGKSLARQRLPHLSSHFHFGWSDAVSELAELAMVDLPVPGVIVVDPVTRVIFLNSTLSISTLDEDSLTSFLHSVSSGNVPKFGGNTFYIRLRRLGRRFLIDLSVFFYARPLVSLLVFGVPIILLSFITYLCCCLDESYSELDHPIVSSIPSSKPSGHLPLSTSTESDSEVVTRCAGRHTSSFRSPKVFTDLGPVVSKRAVEARCIAFEELKKNR